MQNFPGNALYPVGVEHPTIAAADQFIGALAGERCLCAIRLPHDGQLRSSKGGTAVERVVLGSYTTFTT